MTMNSQAPSLSQNQMTQLSTQNPVPDFHEDERIFGKLLADSQHQLRVQRIARKQTRGTAIDWEDAAQTAQEKIWQKLKAQKFDSDRGNFYHWAAIVARFAVIDLVRREKLRTCDSLDRNLPGTNQPILNTIADSANLFDSLEYQDLMQRIRKAIERIDLSYPQRRYLKLWKGKLKGKTQAKLASELGITQGAISKRWKELTVRIVETI
ncbi:sigma-70 family RNA polymerase sigma factor [Spirulina sp. 06S082]|uniref:RNA polymerase sigma factor n=1 Tax=Spirulina sp. 06S082 TaxID=3110248 RepID=UPI002B1F5614|nr:sigma-70 family RNA polymerase sigma factor [Spirulina sp. 06S082]MEA5468054.1 sigma-70 family RNA polymerase sigma factor [Spirulina sp. 06S082]